jgi:hypothetical protein
MAYLKKDVVQKRKQTKLNKTKQMNLKLHFLIGIIAFLK